MKPFAFPLSDGHVRLRLLEKADLEMVRAWRNRDDIRRCFFSSALISAGQQLSWWERYASAEDDWSYVIEALDPDMGPRPVGTIALYHLDPAARTAEYGRLMIGEEWARRGGFARLSSKLLISYAFDHRHLERIHLEVLEGNASAIGLYRSLGFRQEGEPSRPGAIRMVIDRPDQLSSSQAVEAGPAMGRLWDDLVAPWQPERPACPAISLVLVLHPSGARSTAALLEELRAHNHGDLEVLVMDDLATRDRWFVDEVTCPDAAIAHVRFARPAASPAVRVNQAILLARGRRIGVLPQQGVSDSDLLVKGLLEGEDTGADLTVLPTGALLARWKVFLTIGLFDPHPLVADCHQYDLWQRARNAGLTCIGQDIWLQAPDDEGKREHLTEERNQALQLGSIYEYPMHDAK